MDPYPVWFVLTIAVLDLATFMSVALHAVKIKTGRI